MNNRTKKGNTMKKMTEQEFREYDKIIYKAITEFIIKYNYNNHEELRSASYEVLMNCLRNFDESKGCKFTTYLYNNCFCTFFTVLEKENKGRLYKYNNYNISNKYNKYNIKEVMEIQKDEVFNKFSSNELNIEEQLNIEKIIKIIETKVVKEFNKTELKKYYKFKKSFEDEQKIIVDKFLMNKIKYILKNDYNITEKDVSF